MPQYFHVVYCESQGRGDVRIKKETFIHLFVFIKNIIKKRDVSHSTSTGRRFVLTQERRREENTSFLKEKYVNTFVYTSHEEGLLHNSPSMMSYIDLLHPHN